ncbi:unnamed protein product [Ranitomeya imitator]|uniref:Uncharacterized protein n=1 Tax=Ranitomeya imitator TaxID=111125 RepID=A0ABN9KVG9_9NEOB|nr:unnamed protein product [Ranitomeya imitator]
MMEVTGGHQILMMERRCSDTDNDPDRCSVAVWSLESCHTDRSPATKMPVTRVNIGTVCVGTAAGKQSGDVTDAFRLTDAHSQYRRRAEHSAGGQTALGQISQDPAQIYTIPYRSLRSHTDVLSSTSYPAILNNVCSVYASSVSSSHSAIHISGQRQYNLCQLVPVHPEPTGQLLDIC